jgi:hypothetical protein
MLAFTTERRKGRKRRRLERIREKGREISALCKDIQFLFK